MPITLTSTTPATNASHNPDQVTPHSAIGPRVVINGRLGIGKTSMLALCSQPPILLPTSGKQAKRGTR